MRGPAAIAEIAALAFFPDASQEPTGAVRDRAHVRRCTRADATAGTLAAFIAQTTARTPVRNVYVELPTLSALLANFTPDGSATRSGRLEP